MGETFLLANREIKRPAVLRDFTVRDFSGGWNVVDSDLNLSSKFQKILRNMQRGLDGSLAVRPGTRLFADTEDFLDRIVNVTYFNGQIIAVGQNGKIVQVDGAGNVHEIWNTEFAGNLPGAPSAWDVTIFVSFAVFNGELIICNGVNKPLVFGTSGLMGYLQDLADLSNVNTPRCRFVLSHGRNLVMSGDPDDPDALYISNTDTSGTWVGDSAPNDAVTLQLGSRVPTGDHTIKGLGRFRDRLIIAFDEALIPAQLGVFSDDGDHTPTIDDAIEQHGSLSHRVIQTIGEDMFFCDQTGVPSVSRALFTGNIRSERASSLVDPEIRKQIAKIKSIVTLEDKTWAIYDPNSSNYMLFIPDNDDLTDIVEYRGFIYKKDKKLKVESWQEWSDWKWESGCRSALKTIFLTRGTQIFYLGNERLSVTADFVGDEETFSDGVVFTDGHGWTPVANEQDSGVPIEFIFELPWSDHGERFLTKKSRYLSFDVEGDVEFTTKMFVDKIYEDPTDLGEPFLDGLPFDDDFGWNVEVLAPVLQMDFDGGDAPGFGLDGYGDSYGSGRPTQDERLYAWTAAYKINKMRVEGRAIKPGKFVSMSVAYLQGSPRR